MKFPEFAIRSADGKFQLIDTAEFEARIEQAFGQGVQMYTCDVNKYSGDVAFVPVAFALVRVSDVQKDFAAVSAVYNPADKPEATQDSVPPPTDSEAPPASTTCDVCEGRGYNSETYAACFDCAGQGRVHKT